jgi:hypothetical protein
LVSALVSRVGEMDHKEQREWNHSINSLCHYIGGQHLADTNHEIAHQICLTFDVTRKKSFVLIN